MTGLIAGCSSSISQPELRTPGTYVDDVLLSNKIKAAILKELRPLDQERLRVSVYNGVVLLTGQLNTEERKQIAGKTAANVARIRALQNEISTEPIRSILGRTSDSFLSTMIRGKLANDPLVSLDRLDIIVDKGVVYLLGTVSREEGELAANLVSKVRGVGRVVKVFEYVESDQVSQDGN